MVGSVSQRSPLVCTAPVDLRVWVVAKSRSAVITGYAEAAVGLDLADAEEGPERLAGLFLRFVEVTDKDCLVVLDDLTDPADMAGLWLVWEGGGAGPVPRGPIIKKIGTNPPPHHFLNEPRQQSEGGLCPDHPDTLTSATTSPAPTRRPGTVLRAILMFEQHSPTSSGCWPGPPRHAGIPQQPRRRVLVGRDRGRAIPLLEQTLTDRSGSSAPTTPTRWIPHNLASAYESAGDLGRAIPLYEQTVHDRADPGPRPPPHAEPPPTASPAYESAGDLGRAISAVRAGPHRRRADPRPRAPSDAGAPGTTSPRL